MTHHTTPARLILLLLAWMLIVAMACGLILTQEPGLPTSQPRRTRAPLDTRP